MDRKIRSVLSLVAMLALAAGVILAANGKLAPRAAPLATTTNTALPASPTSQSTVTQAAPVTPTLQPTATPAAPLEAYAAVPQGQDVNLRSGPGTTHPVVGSLKAGERARALAKTAGGDWIQVAFPQSADGTAWVYAALVSLSGGPLPVLADSPAYPPALPQDARPLTMQSTPDEIRSLILKPIWTTLWVEAQVVLTSQMANRAASSSRPG